MRLGLYPASRVSDVVLCYCLQECCCAFKVHFYYLGFTLACYAVYGLCETLWGLPRSDKNLIDYEEQMRRKQMLISWLVDTIRAESQVNNRCRVNAGDCSKMIFKLVADGRLDEAVQCALQNGES